MNATPSVRNGARVNPSPEILNSWKEIASYLGRGIRTVQRWESLGLPIRRPRGRARSAVIAVRSELDAWISSCPVTKLPQVTGNLASTQELILESQRIHRELRDSRRGLRQAITSLTQNLKVKLYLRGAA